MRLFGPPACGPDHPIPGDHLDDVGGPFGRSPSLPL